MYNPYRGRDTYTRLSDGGTRYARLPPVIEIIPLSGYLWPRTWACRIKSNRRTPGVGALLFSYCLVVITSYQLPEPKDYKVIQPLELHMSNRYLQSCQVQRPSMKDSYQK